MYPKSLAKQEADPHTAFSGRWPLFRLTRTANFSQGRMIARRGVGSVEPVRHGGVRLGRKVYLVDMADNQNRSAYVAVSNTAIGIVTLGGGLIGPIGDKLGAAAIVLLLGLLSLVAALYIRGLPEVSDPK